MRIKVKSIEEALEVLKSLCVEWITLNKIENSLWDTGIAFFDSSFCRIAYYDEVNHLLSVNKTLKRKSEKRKLLYVPYDQHDEIKM